MWLFYRDTDDETWLEFFQWADLGLPLAYMAWQELATLAEEGTNTINETWAVFCEMIEIDPDGVYMTLKEAFDASPNPPVEKTED